MKLLNLTGMLCFCFCGLMFCCRKKEYKSTETEIKDTLQTQIHLPVKTVYDRLTTLYNYYPNTTRLKEIAKSTGFRYTFIYDKHHRLSEYQIYVNDRFHHFAQIARDSEGAIVKIVKFDVEPVYQRTYYPRGQYTLQFDASKRVNKISDFGADKKLISEKNLRYDERGNLTHLQSAFGDSDAQLTFDLKNGIFKHISDMELIFVMHQDKEFLGTNNNVVGYEDMIKPEEKCTINYEYNGNDYPSKMTVFRKSRTETHLITYMQLEAP